MSRKLKIKDYAGSLFVVDGSESRHCCFEASICAPEYRSRDTKRRRPLNLLEIFERDDAEFVLDSLNYHERLEGVTKAAVKIQEDNYGNATDTHQAMIEWAKEARALLTELENNQ